MLQRSVALGIVSAGQTVVILLGSLDLSVAWLISLSSLILATTMDGQEGNVTPAVVLVLALGVGIGLANGLIITKLRVNAFIATLGTALIIQRHHPEPAGTARGRASRRPSGTSATRASASSRCRSSCWSSSWW